MKKLLVVVCVAALMAFGMTSTASAASPDQGQISSDTLASMGLGSMRQMTDQEGQQIRGTFFLTGGFAGFLQGINVGGGNFLLRTGAGVGAQGGGGTTPFAGGLGGFYVHTPPLQDAWGIGGGIVFKF